MPKWHHIPRRPFLGLQASPLILCLALLWFAIPGTGAGLQEIRYWSLGEVTRVVVQFDGEFSFKWSRLEDPPRAFFDLPQVELRLVKDARDRGRIRTIEVNDPILRQIRYAENSPGTARVVLDLNESCTITTSQLANPARLVIELRTKKMASPEVLVSRTGVVDAATPAGDAQSPEAPEESPAEPTEMPLTAITPASSEFAPADSAPIPGSPTGAAEVAEHAGQGDAHPSVISAAHVATVAANEALEELPDSRPAAPEAVLPGSATARPSIPDTPKDVGGASAATVPAELEMPADSQEIALAKPATRTVNGRQSLVRALGLKIGKVVIDPGHGGKDHGTTGVKGLKEKDLVLDISQRLAVLVQERLGSEVVLTRDADVFVPLEERTEIANRNRADLFISVHANSSPYKLASGSETFFLNFTSSRDAMDVAARENASAQRSVGELQDIVRRIALKDKRDESEDFAARIQGALFKSQRQSGIVLKNRGVKSAPFIVLVGAEMPSILVEVGFLSNVKEEAALKTPAYRQKLAEALLEGLEAYMDSLSHLEVTERAAVQE